MAAFAFMGPALRGIPGTVPTSSAVHAPRAGHSAAGAEAPYLGGVGIAGGIAVSGAAGAAGAAVIAVAAVCGFLAVVARRRRGQGRSRVALGPTGGCWYKYKFRAKPGDKFKYRFSTDVLQPEFGYFPAEPQGRVIKYGELLAKGTPLGPIKYKQEKEGEESAMAAKAGAVRGALLLDCDGTLVETERDGHRVAFNQAFKELEYNCEWDVALYGDLLTTGGGKERMTRYFTDINPGAWPHEETPEPNHPSIRRLHEVKTKLFMDIVRSGALPLREGVEELLSAAQASGWALAVCSTSNEESVKAIVETLLPAYAPSMRIFAGDCVKAKKPNPEIYLLAAKTLGVAPMKCVVVEDSNIGLQAGKAANMQVVVTKSIYTKDEDFEGADLVLPSAVEVDFQRDVVALLPTLQLA